MFVVTSRCRTSPHCPSRARTHFLGVRISTLAAAIAALLWVSKALALPPSQAEEADPRLRVCCPLGFDLPLRVGPLALPARLGNVVEAGRIGHHRYLRRSVFDEINGLVYTCRGGLLDLGHLRTAADLVGWLYVHLRRARATRGRVRLRGPDGAIELKVRPRATEETLRRIAAQVAFRLTVWHELVTFQGRRTVAAFPEGFSAFSPEDLVSDAWGARVGYDSILSPEAWDQAVDRAVDRVLRDLESRPLMDTRTALHALADRWWNPTRAVPESSLLQERRFEVSPPIPPLITSAVRACRGSSSATAVLPAHDEAGDPLESWYALRIPDAPGWASTSTTGEITGLTLKTLAAPARAATQPSNPSPRRSFANAQQAIRILPVRFFGGTVVHDTARAAFGVSIDGGRTETFGGDVTVLRLTTLLGPEDRGLVTHITGLRADALFFCREHDTENIHPPIAAWFQGCERGGLIGLGGRLLTAQIDGKTGRFVLQPIETHLAVDILQTAFSDGYFRHRLVAELGGAVETANQRVRDADLSVRGRATVHGLVRNRNQRFELSARVFVHQDVTESDDRGIESHLRLLFRTPSPPRQSDEPSWGQVELGAEFAFRRWTRPGSSLADDALPLGSSDRPNSWHAVLFVGFIAGGLTF